VNDSFYFILLLLVDFCAGRFVNHVLWRDEHSVGGNPWEFSLFGGGGGARAVAAIHLSVGSPILELSAYVDSTFYVEEEIYSSCGEQEVVVKLRKDRLR
jgi:hypothetical protein